LAGSEVPLAVFLSFRFGAPDGVSVESAKWAAAFGRLGFGVRTVAGEPPADVVVAGLGRTPAGAVDEPALLAALADADLVVVENLCSLPLNPVAAETVARLLAARPAVLHHHDLAWQRAPFASSTYRIPDDARWRHVVINDMSREELLARGIEARTIRNAFDTDAAEGDRIGTRQALGVPTDRRLFLQPTRAIERKNVPAALRLAEELDAVYWLLGPAEDGYGDELERLLASTSATWVHGPAGTHAGTDVAHAYAAADLVVFPSTWEGFGNPVVESAIFRRPLAIGRYPVARELAQFGFRWLDAADADAVRGWLDRPDPSWLDHNRDVARRHFSLAALDAELARLVADVTATART
jgi:mannosylglucosylglycerate synthase